MKRYMKLRLVLNGIVVMLIPILLRMYGDEKIIYDENPVLFFQIQQLHMMI